MSQKKYKRHAKGDRVSQLTYDAYLVHLHWMEYALKLAQRDRQEIPVAAVIVDESANLIAEATNQKEQTADATAHAEMLAIRQASRVKQNWCLKDCTLYVTLEPCAMCAGAIINSRLGLLVYGASEPKTGAIRTVINLPDSECSNHRLHVIAGIKEDACTELLRTWFSRRRNQTRSDLGLI